MGSRRLEKMARVIKEAVSDAILNHLNDPRITGVITVTNVKLTPDMKVADVYLSILAENEKKQARTFEAIQHAGNHIRSLIGKDVTAKYLPRLEFHMDENYKKTLETLRLIDEVSKEFKESQDLDTGNENEEQ